MRYKMMKESLPEMRSHVLPARKHLGLYMELFHHTTRIEEYQLHEDTAMGGGNQWMENR